MDRFVFTSLSAAKSQEFNRIQLTHDLANLSTTGYQRSNITTTKTAYLKGPGFQTNFQPVLTTMVNNISIRPGPIAYTGKNTDVAMNESTVLGVQADDGNIAFTRRGDLRVSATGLLVNGAGHVVMAEGAPLTVPPGFLIDIGADGSVYATDPNEEAGAPAVIGALMLRDASNVVLVRRNDGLFETEGSGGLGGDFESGPNPASISTGSLEGSNVNPIEVMVSLLDLYRSFEMQMKIVKKSEEIDQDGTRMIGLR